MATKKKTRVLTLGDVARAASRAREPYLLGSRVLLARVASLLDVDLRDIREALLDNFQAGRLVLSRLDLPQVFIERGVGKAVERSAITRHGAEFHLLDR